MQPGTKANLFRITIWLPNMKTIHKVVATSSDMMRIVNYYTKRGCSADVQDLYADEVGGIQVGPGEKLGWK